MGEGPATVVLEFDGKGISLNPGTNAVGRGVDCQIRLKDAAVSRRHLLLHVREDGVWAEDLESANGTRLNGAPFTTKLQVENGDVLQVGSTQLALRFVEAGESSESLNDETMVGWDGMASYTSRMCAKCGSVIDPDDDECLICMPSNRRTFRMKASMAHYQSESLAFDAEVQSWGGNSYFIATPLLEAVGTECQLTLDPDGINPVTQKGVVKQVVDSSKNAAGQEAGMLVELVPPQS